MREILFRGIDIATGEMVIGQGINMAYDTPRLFIGLNAHTVDRKTVGQFTGITDCNGVKIFEGDIVEDDEYFRSAIYWDENNFMFCATDVGGLIDMCAPIKVIGNIHQNPELLERTHG